MLSLTLALTDLLLGFEQVRSRKLRTRFRNSLFRYAADVPILGSLKPFLHDAYTADIAVQFAKHADFVHRVGVVLLHLRCAED